MDGTKGGKIDALPQKKLCNSSKNDPKTWFCDNFCIWLLHMSKKSIIFVADFETPPNPLSKGEGKD